MIFIAAVPQIRETVTPTGPVVVIDSDSDSENESDAEESREEHSKDEEDASETASIVRYCVNPAHVRDLDLERKVISLRIV